MSHIPWVSLQLQPFCIVNKEVLSCPVAPIIFCDNLQHKGAKILWCEVMFYLGLMKKNPNLKQNPIPKLSSFLCILQERFLNANVTKAIWSHIPLRHAYKAGDRHITDFHAQRQSEYGCRSLFRFVMCITLFSAGISCIVIIVTLVTCCHAIHNSCQLWNYLVWPKWCLLLCCDVQIL